MKETVTRACGCEERVNLIGSQYHRDRKREWYQSTACTEHHHQAEAKRASEQNTAAGLPALAGSEKQIAWAEQIRAKALEANRKALFVTVKDDAPERIRTGGEELIRRLQVAYSALQARLAADQAERDDAVRVRAATAASATTFAVALEGAVTLGRGKALTIRGVDGRTATGWIMDGEWAVCALEGAPIDSLHPEAERIAAAARAQWEARG
jgi:hypothetical protein